MYDFKATTFEVKSRSVLRAEGFEPSRTPISGVGGHEKVGFVPKREMFVALTRHGDGLTLQLGDEEYDATADTFETSMFRWIPGLKRFCVHRAGRREACIWYSPRIGADGIDGDDLLETIHLALRDGKSKSDVLAQWVPAA